MTKDRQESLKTLAVLFRHARHAEVTMLSGSRLTLNADILKDIATMLERACDSAQDKTAEAMA